MKPASKPSLVRIGAGVTLAIVAVAITGIAYVNHALNADIREQEQKNAAMRAFADAVAKRIAVGDAVESAVLVLEKARATYVDDKAQSMLGTTFRTGPGSGVILIVRYDQNRRVSKVEISEGVTSL